MRPVFILSESILLQTKSSSDEVFVSLYKYGQSNGFFFITWAKSWSALPQNCYASCLISLKKCNKQSTFSLKVGEWAINWYWRSMFHIPFLAALSIFGICSFNSEGICHDEGDNPNIDSMSNFLSDTNAFKDENIKMYHIWLKKILKFNLL